MESYTNVYCFIEDHKRKNPNSHYFDHDTLKFFGERVSEMRILKEISTVTDCSGETRQAFCLSSLQRKYPSGPRRKYTYFDVGTLEDIIL